MPTGKVCGHELPELCRMLAAGASGYVTKDRIAVDLVKAIVESSGRL